MAKNKTSFNGEKAGPGRPPGSPNKVPKTVKEGFLNAFIEMQSDPANNILAWGKTNPGLFYTLASKLIPTEVKGAFTGKTTLEIVRKPGTAVNPE